MSVTAIKRILWAMGFVTANDDNPAAKAEPTPGDSMEDGTIYVGISPDTKQPMYTTPADAPLTMQWKVAMKYASKLRAHGHKDWRVPTEAELNVLYENRDKGALKGAWDASRSDPAKWYWCSTEYNFIGALVQRFSGGHQGWNNQGNVSSLRCVR